MAQLRVAKFMCIPDLLALGDPSQAGMLRVIGKLDRCDIKNDLIWIEDPFNQSLQVAVSSSNIESLPKNPGVLYQFIGEADYRDISTEDGTTTKCLLLKALTCRCMDGLDMTIYLRSQEARMAELQESNDIPEPREY